MVRVWPVALFVIVTATLGTAAPEGSVTVPAKPEVPEDCAIKAGINSANNSVSARVAVTCERSKVLIFIVSPKLTLAREGADTRCMQPTAPLLGLYARFHGEQVKTAAKLTTTDKT